MDITKLNPHIDADYIVYRVGFAVKDDEPIEYALSTVKHAIENVWAKFPKATTRRVFISGKNNFRDKIATIQVYKGNRDPAKKPKFYDEIRQYMVDYHGAEIVNGMEAEDAAAIQQYSHKDKSTILVGQDKDLQCIPGWHFNPVKDTLHYQTLADANVSFWKQVITGDRTDNILGLEGYGPVAANKIIDPCNKDWDAMYRATLDEYGKVYGSRAFDVMHETAQLVWILRKEGETYDGSSIEA